MFGEYIWQKFNDRLDFPQPDSIYQIQHQMYLRKTEIGGGPNHTLSPLSAKCAPIA